MRTPTARELSFVFNGHPRPRGLRATGVGRLLCAALGHRAPMPGAGCIVDRLPRAVSTTFVWACPACGVRFRHTFIVTHGTSSADEQARRLAREAFRQLYLDVLHELNLGRLWTLRGPLRSIPTMENGPDPIEVDIEHEFGLKTSPPPD